LVVNAYNCSLLTTYLPINFIWLMLISQFQFD